MYGKYEILRDCGLIGDSIKDQVKNIVEMDEDTAFEIWVKVSAKLEYLYQESIDSALYMDYSSYKSRENIRRLRSTLSKREKLSHSQKEMIKRAEAIKWKLHANEKRTNQIRLAYLRKENSQKVKKYTYYLNQCKALSMLGDIRSNLLMMLLSGDYYDEHGRYQYKALLTINTGNEHSLKESIDRNFQFLRVLLRDMEKKVQNCYQLTDEARRILNQDGLLLERITEDTYSDEMMKFFKR